MTVCLSHLLMPIPQSSNRIQKHCNCLDYICQLIIRRVGNELCSLLEKPLVPLAPNGSDGSLVTRQLMERVPN